LENKVSGGNVREGPERSVNDPQRAMRCDGE